MASEASAAEQTTDGQVEEKKVADDAKIVNEEDASPSQETGESEKILEKPNVEEPASSEIVQTDYKESVEDNKGEEPVVEVGKKEDEVGEPPASGVLEEAKAVAPTVDEVKKEDEEAKASSSDIMGNKEDDTSAAEVVKDGAETDKASNLDEPKIEAFEREPEKKSTATAESLSEAVQKPSVESELSFVHESNQVTQEPEVAESVTEIMITTGGPLDDSGYPVVSSETPTLSEEQPTTLVVTESAPPDASGEPEEKNEALAAHEVVEASEDEKVSSVEIGTGSGLLKEELDVKEIGSSSTLQDLDAVLGDPTEVNETEAVGSKDAFPENTEKSVGDIGVHGCAEATMNDESGQDASKSLVKEVSVDTDNQPPSTIVGKSEKIDTDLVTQGAEIVAKPEVSGEEHKEEKAVVTETAVDGCKEVETEDKEAVDEQEEEEKPVAIESTLTATTETVNPGGPATEFPEDFSEKDKPSEDGEKAIEEQREVAGSHFTTEVTKICSEKEKPSEVAEKAAEELKDESVKDDTTMVQASRERDLGEANEADISLKEALGTSDVVEKTDIGSIEKEDETREKKDESQETEKTEPQDLVQSSQDGAGLKTDVEVQKSEAPAKPKTLMSKVKHSIGKVKKAIIGKSPNSKTMSAEPKDELKTN